MTKWWGRGEVTGEAIYEQDLITDYRRTDASTRLILCSIQIPNVRLRQMRPRIILDRVVPG